MIYIISCGISVDSVTEKNKELINGAQVVAGGKRLLKMFANDNQEQVSICAEAIDTVKELVSYSNNKNVVILASGDALFHGIAGTVSKITNNYTAIPNVTAFQSLCAKINQPWSRFELFSIHGRKGFIPWRKLLSASRAIIYCDNISPAHITAARFIEKHPASSRRLAVSCADLGLGTESINRGTLEDLAKIETSGLSILMLLETDSASMYPVLPLGLDDSHYEHEKNLITHQEVRAVILSKLRLRGGVMWDLGAGSGSVGLEAAGVCKNLNVYAVEKSSVRVKNIRDNASAEELTNYNVISGNILECITELPSPDIIFIGGGGKGIKDIVKNAYNRLNVGGHIVASAVTLETIGTLNSVLEGKIAEVVSIAVSRSKSAGSLTMMKAENQITIFTCLSKTNSSL